MIWGLGATTMTDDPEVFAVSTTKIAKGAFVGGAAGVVLALLVGARLLFDTPQWSVGTSWGRLDLRLCLAAAVPLLALLAAVVVSRRATRMRIELAIGTAGLTVTYLRRLTVVPWSTVERVVVTMPAGRGVLLIAPRPELKLAGGWRLRWWAGPLMYGAARAGSGFPRWSPTHRGSVEVWREHRRAAAGFCRRDGSHVR